MRKKVIFMVINMNIGGTERALLNMIEEMSNDKYEITILMLEKYGGFLEYIHKKVQRKYLEQYSEMKDILNHPPKEIIKNYFKKGFILKGIILLYIFLISKIFKTNSVLYKYLLKDVPKLINEYDIAVAYAGPMDFISYFVIHKITAKRKIQWIHFDVTKIGFNKAFARNIYQQFDQLVVVSKQAKLKFIKMFPSLDNQTIVVHNIVSSTYIIEQANKNNLMVQNKRNLTILTVGRLSIEKGQDLAIKTLAELKRNGYRLSWYCVGDGNARNYYEKLIKKYHLQDSFILLGSKTNPYPYMKLCDIYVQPSKYEGYSMTILEAKCLCKPIICTNFTGINEQLVNGKTGLIVNNNVYELSDAIKQIINNKLLKENLTTNLKGELEEIKKKTRDHIDEIFQLY